MKTFYHHGLLYISVKSVFQTNVAIRWKILSHKLYASIVQFSCVQWNFKRPFFNQSRFVRSNLFPSTYNFVFVLFFFLIWQIIDARKYDNKGTACTVYIAKTALPIYCQEINMTMVVVKTDRVHLLSFFVLFQNFPICLSDFYFIAL